VAKAYAFKTAKPNIWLIFRNFHTAPYFLPTLQSQTLQFAGQNGTRRFGDSHHAKFIPDSPVSA